MPGWGAKGSGRRFAGFAKDDLDHFKPRGLVKTVANLASLTIAGYYGSNP